MSADGGDFKSVRLTGPVTLYESSEVREALLAALTEGVPLRVDLELSGPWDLAGFQLLISAVASGRKAGVAVQFVHIPGVCREIADRSGLGDWLAGAAVSYQ